jgi:serine/threonine-protein kinase
MDAFVTADFAGLAMELVDGVDLSRVLADQPLPYRAALEIARTLAAALHEAHRNGVLHRDLKPGNVLLCSAGQVKLIDFGIAKFADTRLTATGQVLGTPSYMSPEQWRGETLDHRSDLWSLGVLLHEMLSGRRAFPGAGMAEVAARVLEQPPERLPERSVDGENLAGAATLLAAVLDKSPAGRPVDAAEMLARLDNLLEGI